MTERQHSKAQLLLVCVLFSRSIEIVLELPVPRSIGELHLDIADFDKTIVMASGIMLGIPAHWLTSS